MAKKPPFEVLLCDLGNVIAFYDHMISAQNLARIVGIPAEEAFKRVFESEYNQAFVLGHIDQHEFYSRMQMQFEGLPFPSYDQFVNIWVMIFRPNHRMVEALDELHGKVKMVLVSNTNVLHFNWISSKFPEIVSPFGKNLILSHEVHLQKPQPEIFHAALKLVDATPEQCLFVDDNAEFVAAATELGIKSLHYTDHRRFLHAAFPGEYLP